MPSNSNSSRLSSRYNDIINQLSADISDTVGNIHEDDLESISSTFDRTLSDALKSFNSSTFDDDGFIKKIRDIELDNKKDKDLVRNVLNNLQSDYVNVETLNHSELLLRRDLVNICTQMPEMRDVVYVVRDAIIECNVSTGEVSRSLTFEDHSDTDDYERQVKEIEKHHDLLMATKNFIVPNTLRTGEMYIHVVPYAKLFAEIETIRDSKYGGISQSQKSANSVFKESIPNTVKESFSEHVSLYSDENVRVLMESVSPITKVDTSDTHKIEQNGDKNVTDANAITKSEIKSILENIEVCNGSSVFLEEMGADGFEKFIVDEYSKQRASQRRKSKSQDTHFSEAMDYNNFSNNTFGRIDQDDVNLGSYADVKGCYIKYLDSLRIVPIRMDRRVIGYYYVTTTMDLQHNPAQPTGIVDLSFQHYTKDKNLVDNLANMIIRSFDKKFLEKNIKLKNEIAEIIMAHKFSEGRLSFIYIPENEIVRLVINEDEEGKGHSILEPSLFPARMYLMLTMYNMLYTLNNNTTRIHYMRSSGLNKDYAAQIQRTMRKFQSRRITIDDIYSFSGVLNKIGGMGEIVLPAGRNDYKALDTDTIEAVQNPVSVEFLEQQRRQALSGTGVPSLLVINALDEVDFAKTLEMANARFLSTVSAYKIDFNRGLTKLYQKLMKYDSDLDDDIIQAFRYQFNAIKQQDLNITAEMITNFNALVDMVASIYYSKKEMEDEKGNPTPKQMHLRRELAKEYLPQLDFDRLEAIIKKVNLDEKDDQLQQKVSDLTINKKDLDEMNEE